MNDTLGKCESMRDGFSRGLVRAGHENEKVLALSADLGPSVKTLDFQKEFGSRYIEVGVAEQNLVTVASGLARAGYLPFATSFAAFSPGRNWEQIRTTICLNNQNVKIIGSHAGLSAAQDGATHQILEDMALMRALPNMVVIAPGDSLEAEQATVAIAKTNQPTYLRISRSDLPIFTSDDDHFEIGRAKILQEGEDITLLGTGVMTHVLLGAAKMLKDRGISAEVIHAPTIKPLDSEAILRSVAKTKLVATAEEAQIAGGFGSAVAELLSDELPTKILRLGIDDQFGQTGLIDDLMRHYGLTKDQLTKKIEHFVKEARETNQWD